ncbi:Toxin-antitoxin system, toxin component domain protein [Lactobacillus equicursoris 66c]|uniref:Toxin-antitoxin system, toxin component domain protein n=2 Tax=Lactobacillus equicursoris TaxID=420645 RepID=K0NGG5_9LACO|nr:Toxin-antitoxin system, toxin component domain protein [Lactobacillus equicursoris 66c]
MTKMRAKHKVIYCPIEAEGYYIADLDLIVISSELTPLKRKYVLEYELAHIEQSPTLYVATPAEHIRLEFEANCSMIAGMLDDYLGQTDLSIEEISKTLFMEQCGLSRQYDSAIDHVLAQRLKGMQAAL